MSDQSLELIQGTLYPAMVRLEQYGWLKDPCGKTESNREAKFYAITPAGRRALEKETTRWRRMSELVERLLLDEAQA